MRRPGLAERLLPNPEKNVPYLDAIRGMAVLFILIRHAWGISGEPNYTIFGHSLSPFIMMMSSGVDLFFVLSGYLLSGRFLRADAQGKPALSFKSYFKARLLRIAPPYWAVLALVLLLFTPTFIPNDRIYSSHGAFMVLAHATFTQSLFIVSFGAYMIDAPFWTLTVEMAFYLMLPFAIRGFYNFRWWQGALASIMLTFAWLYLSRYSMGGLVESIRHHAFGLAYSDPGTRFFLSRQIMGYLPHFAIGCSIAAIMQRRPKNAFTSATAGAAYLVTGIFIMLAAMAFDGRLSVIHGYTNPERLLADQSLDALAFYFLETTPFAIAYGLIILGATLAHQRVRDWISAVPGLTLLGILGYSIYLIHMPIMYVLNKHAVIANIASPAAHFPALLTISTIVVMIASCGLFMAIERPSMVWASRVPRDTTSGDFKVLNRIRHAMRSESETRKNSGTGSGD